MPPSNFTPMDSTRSNPSNKPNQTNRSFDDKGPGSLPSGPATAARDNTGGNPWFQIISAQLAAIERAIRETGGKGGGGGGNGGGGRKPKPKKEDGALARLGKFWSHVSNIGGGLGQIGRNLARGRLGQAAFGMARVGQAAQGLSSMAGGMGAGASAALIPVGAAVAVVSFLKATKDAADELIELRKELANVSGLMAVRYAQRDIQEILRERKRGDILADSTGLLIRGEQKWKDEIFPWEVAWQELKTNYLAGFYTALADVAGGVNGIAEMLGIEIKKMKVGEDTSSFSALINQVNDNAKKRQEDARKRAGAK